ncbi:hypothetical protein I3842_15G130900 [Carya illinoinensis]|uniref:Uncharacterized protein n=1 Tax=Carya illinoinensis TaxID=32201 RepID=A0A922DBJ3_CARIL|nr:hypothetical protein I3842_15G130900 [Carya illinoinensis]
MRSDRISCAALSWFLWAWILQAGCSDSRDGWPLYRTCCSLEKSLSEFVNDLYRSCFMR